jgi:TolB protein
MNKSLKSTPARLVALSALLLFAACSDAGSPTASPEAVASATGTSTVTAAPPAASPTAPQPTVLPRTETPAALNDLTGKIVYSTEGDVWSMNADGTGVTRLTTDPAEDFDPVWSPDGTRIAFRSHRDGDEEVYIMNADGSDPQNLTNAPGGDYSPAWSPNGEWIAFMSDRAGNNNIWIIRPDGTGLRQITDLPGISEYPSWSPDSSRIVFTCTFGRRIAGGAGDFEICIVNADGTGLIQLTDEPGESTQPAWGPDGRTIAFESNRDGWPTLPDFTPLGYDPGDFGDDEIYIMQVDGSGQVNLTNNPREGDSFPAWSRDGRLIFTRYGCLMVMNADGSGLAQISAGVCTGTDSGVFPDWFQEPITGSSLFP